MKKIRQFSGSFFQMLGSPEDWVFKSGLFPAVTAFTFSKLTLQEKILIMGKLINRFRSDDSFIVKVAERALLAMNHKLNRQITKAWNDSIPEEMQQSKKGAS